MWHMIRLITAVFAFTLLLNVRPVSAACPAPRPGPGGNAVWVDDLVVPFGSTTATIAVRLSAAVAVAGTQNDLTLPATLSVIAKANGRPDCAVNPAIDKGSSSFVFRPVGCSGDACTGIRALIFSSENLEPIADGVVLYTCNVDLEADAEVGVVGVVLGTPDGNPIGGSGAREGHVCIADPPPSPSVTATATTSLTATTTRTSSPTPSVTSTPTPTPSASPSATRTSTATASPTLTATETPITPMCIGDCNADREVTIDELIVAVNVALGDAVTRCPPADGNHDLEVTIDELISAVGRALDGCG